MFINIGNQHINVAHIAKIDPEAMTITTNGGEVFTATDRDSDLYRFILSGGGERMIPATAGWTYKLQRDGRLEKVAAWFISSSGNFLPVTVEGGFRWGTGYLATLISPDGQAMIDTSYLQGEFKPQMTVPVDRLEATYREFPTTGGWGMFATEEETKPLLCDANKIIQRIVAGIRYSEFVGLYGRAKAIENLAERTIVADVLKWQFFEFDEELRSEIADCLRRTDPETHEDEPFIWDAA